MKKLIIFKNDDNTEVQVEVNDPKQAGMEQAGLGASTELARDKFEKALANLQPLTGTVMRTLRELNNPDEFTIEFGITLSTEAGVLIASASAEANISVSMKWSNKKQP